MIFEELCSAGFQPAYEKALEIGPDTRYPDFTFKPAGFDRPVYWEHLGMMERPEHLPGWEKKLAWYRANQILPVEEGGGANGVLVTSSESHATGVNLSDVQEIIGKLLNKTSRSVEPHLPSLNALPSLLEPSFPPLIRALPVAAH